MKKRILATLLTLVMLLGLMPTMALADEITPVKPIEIKPDYSWYSAEASEYEIDSIEDLAGLAKLTQDNVVVDEATTLTKTDFANKTVKLNASLTFADDQYLYYANSDNTVVYDYRIGSFAGIFDGQGNTIYGLKFCNENISQNPYMYLFNVITVDGSIENITLDTVTADINGYDYFGFLAKTLNGSATNCHVKNATANVAVNKDNKAYLCQTAAMFGYVKSATITDCTVSGFKINAPEGTDSTDRVGALIGQSDGTAADTANGIAANPTTITNCSVDGIEFDLACKTKRLGGFVGQTSNTIITDCTATNVNISVGNYYQTLGGFSGYAGSNSTYEKCTLTKYVLKANSTDYGGYAGGFAGTATGNKIRFIDCSVTGLDMNLEYCDGRTWYAGGFVVDTDGSDMTFTHCSVSGEIDVVCTNENAKKDFPVGGFFGLTTDACTAEDCTVSVSVTGPCEAGGFVGICNGGDFTDCAASGTITGETSGGFVGTCNGGAFEGCSANGNVSGNTAGGFIGEIVPDTSNAADKAVIVNDCEAGGTVAGDGLASGFVGALSTAGENDKNATTVTITNSTTKSEVTGTQDTTKIIEFTEENIADGSHTHYEGSGNKVLHKVVVVGGQAYYTFQEAIEAANDGDTITLVGDVEEADVEITKNLVIDLGGYTLTGNFIVSKKATLENGTVNAESLGVSTFAVDGGIDAIAVDGGEAIINSGTYRGGLSASNEGKITVYGGTFSEDPTAYLADGLTATQTSIGWVVVTAPEFVVATDKDEYNPGEEIKVTVSYSGNSNIYGYAYKLNYENDKVTLKTKPSEADDNLAVNEHINLKDGNNQFENIFTFNANTFVDKGDVEATFNLSGAEVTIAVEDAIPGLGDATSVVVTPTTITILGKIDVTVPENLTEEYTGQPITVPTIITVPDDAAVSYTIDEGSATDAPTVTNVGTYTISYAVTKEGYQTVEGSYEFEVTPHTISEENFNIDDSDKTYTGEEIEPEVTANNLQDSDYDVTYSENTNVGKATITITPKSDNVGGEPIVKTFQITPAPLTVAVNNANVLLGDSLDKAVTYSITGWVNGENIETDLKNGLTYTMEGTGNAVGDTRTVTPKLTDEYTATWPDALKNYEVTTFTSGTLTIKGLTEGSETTGGHYVIEIIRADSEAQTNDYINGYAMVLVYTNKNVTFNYDGVLMVDTMKHGSGEGKYLYNGTDEYAHVYAAVVKLTDGAIDNDIIRSKIATNASIDDTVGLRKLSTNVNEVNQTSKVDNADLVCDSGVLNSDLYDYNTSAPYILIAADVNGDKYVTADDTASVKIAGMPQ